MNKYLTKGMLLPNSRNRWTSPGRWWETGGRTTWSWWFGSSSKSPRWRPAGPPCSSPSPRGTSTPASGETTTKAGGGGGGGGEGRGQGCPHNQAETWHLGRAGSPAQQTEKTEKASKQVLEDENSFIETIGSKIMSGLKHQLYILCSKLCFTIWQARQKQFFVVTQQKQ